MRRREFIAAVGIAVTWPLAARAQQATKTPQIGILSPSRSEEASPNRVTLQAFVAGMRELGYVDGQNITIERALSEANADRLREAAAELVKHKVARHRLTIQSQHSQFGRRSAQALPWFRLTSWERDWRRAWGDRLCLENYRLR
jgi:hypothetical protein